MAERNYKFAEWRISETLISPSGRKGRAFRAIRMPSETHMRKNDDDGSSMPWDRQVVHLVRSEGLPRDKARDRVILDWLKRGDSKALAALLIDGHMPAPNVRIVLALMLLDIADVDAAINRHNLDPELWQLPYRLVMKVNPGKRRHPGRARAERDRLLDKNVGRLMPELGYQAAIDRLDEAVRATGGAVRKQPIPERRPAKKRKK
jgi:hypothetical protein